MSEMPSGWVSGTLGDFTAPERIGVNPDRVPNLPYLGLEHVQAQTTHILKTAPSSSVRSTSYQFRSGATLYARLRPYLNKVCTPVFEGIGSGEFIIFPSSPQLAPGFLKYLLNQPAFVAFTATLDTGDRPRVGWSDIRHFRCALPPLREQERIVAAIDAQFSRLDAGVVALERVRENLKRMQAAVLQAAVSGRLVPDEVSRWDKRHLASAGTLDRGKSRHRPRGDPALYGGPYPFIQTGDVAAADPWIDRHTQTYNSLGLEQSRLWPSGTLCITIAANIAKTGLLTFDSCFPDSVVGFIAHDGPTATRWVELVLRSMQGRLERLAPATAQKNINLAVLRTLEIPYPEVTYQTKVIDEYDRQMSLLGALARVVDAAVETAGGLRVSILAHAFLGMLVPQDPNDEPASVLLERIEAEHASSNGKRAIKTRGGRRRKVTS